MARGGVQLRGRHSKIIEDIHLRRLLLEDCDFLAQVTTTYWKIRFPGNEAVTQESGDFLEEAQMCLYPLYKL